VLAAVELVETNKIPTSSIIAGEDVVANGFFTSPATSSTPIASRFGRDASLESKQVLWSDVITCGTTVVWGNTVIWGSTEVWATRFTGAHPRATRFIGHVRWRHDLLGYVRWRYDLLGYVRWRHDLLGHVSWRHDLLGTSAGDTIYWAQLTEPRITGSWLIVLVV